MEMDSSFMLKQFVAIEELKPSCLSSALDEFCKVYARAVLKLLLQLPTKDVCSYGYRRREYFFNLKNRKGLVSLERSHLVGISFYKLESKVDYSKACGCINCLIREKVVTFRMVKLNMLLSIFLITK